MQDFRYALRTLRRQPVFTLVAVLTLTLGIGANTAIFSLLYQALLRPLPYADAGRLVFVANGWKDGSLTSVSIPDYLDRRREAPAIEDATLFTTRNATLMSGGTPEQVRALAVTPSFFSTLGRHPRTGRPFTDADAVPGASRSVILTDAAWRARFGADTAAVGRGMTIDGQDYEIVGVLPADFDLPAKNITLLVPFAFTPAQMSDAQRGQEFSEMIARLAPGATVQQANAQMQAIVARLIDRLPARADYMRSSGFTGVAIPMRDRIAGDARTPLLLLQAGVLLVLLVACANVANLLMMRATGRGRELAIRVTLGARRARIVRQLLVEGLVLSLLGATGGIALAAFGVRFLVAMVADQIPAASQASVDPAVLGFTLLVALTTGTVFGLVPAISISRGGTAASLKEDGTRSSATRRTRAARSALVVAEVAMAVTLLIGAGLLLKSFSRILDVNPGFSTDHVLSAQVTLPATRYPNADALRAVWPRLLDRVQAIPGVRSVALTGAVPFSGQDGSGTYRLLDRPPGTGEVMPHAFLTTVGGDFFKTMEIPVLAGRVFNETDTATAQRVVVIDDFLAKRRFAGQDPIGRQLNFGSPRNYTIVGVVGNVNGGDLAAPVAEERIYFTNTQVTQSIMGLAIKTAVDPATIAAPLRTAIRDVDPAQGISDVRTLDEWRTRALQPRRTPATLLALFGAISAVLAAIGIYGVLAFGVAERTREFGIRQALGADGASILSIVLKQGIATAVTGIVLGLASSLALARYLESLLFGVRPHDMPVFAAAAALLFAVALAACYVPARRATRIDPMTALRDA